MASIDDVISLDRITSNPAYDFVSHFITKTDDHDNDNVDVLNNVSPYVESNCKHINELGYISEFKGKNNQTFMSHNIQSLPSKLT